MANWLQRMRPAFMGNQLTAKPADNEERSTQLGSVYPFDLWGFPTDWSNTGKSVTIQSALSVPAVWDAVKKVSETLASLPLDLFKKTDTGSEPATNHPVRYIIRSEPSPYVTSYEFRRALFAQACFGDGFARIHRNGNGRPSRFELMMGSVSVGQKDDGGIFYVWYWHKGNTSGKEVLLPQDVLHIRGFNIDTMRGMDVTSVHKASLGFAIGANEYGNNFFANNASVDKVLTYPGTLTKVQDAQLQSKIGGVSGVNKSGSTLVLDAGMDLKKIGLSPEEAMLNESRTFQVNETGGRIFGVPVHLLSNMDRATFNNIETMNTTFVTLCLRPWAVQAEQEMFIKLLTRDEKESDTLFFRHNFEGLLRGDTAARSALYASGILNGWLTRNEVREKENLNTIEGLDDPLVPANMNMIDEHGEIEATAQETTNTQEPGEPGAGGKKQEDGTTQSES
jgi:HK97 family phage portal protein